MTTNTTGPAVPVPSSHFQSKLNTVSPKDGAAKIVSRSSPVRGVVTYTLQVGITSIPEVGIAELMDYVSEHDLEVFENQQFEKDIIEEETKQKQRLAAKAHALRQNRSLSSSDRGSVSGASLSGGENTRTAVGGRQRPTYTHFYPKQRAPRGSLNSKPTTSASYKSSVQKSNGANHRDSKRRRLREDRDGSISSAQESIYSVASLDPPPTQPPSAMEQAAGLLSDTHDSDPMDVDEESDNDINMPIRQPTEREVARDKGKTTASAFFTFRDHAVPSGSRNAAPKSSQIQSAKDKLVTSLNAQKASATTPSASASNPQAATTSNNINSTRQAVVNPNDSESESEDDSDNSEVYTVEKILAHNKSDPRSHNTSVHGEKPVMLYLVKWEGYEDTTWEPATSFQDNDVLQEYWAQQAQKQKQKASSSKDAAMLKGQRKGL